MYIYHIMYIFAGVDAQEIEYTEIKSFLSMPGVRGEEPSKMTTFAPENASRKSFVITSPFNNVGALSASSYAIANI